MKKEKVLIIAAVLSAVLLYACSSPMSGGGGGTGTLTITIPSPEGGRAAIPWDTNIQIEDLDLTIKLLNGPGPNQTRTSVKTGNTVNFTVVVGTWEVFVEAYKDGELVAEGSKVVDVKPGQNNIARVTMGPSDGTITITSPEGGSQQGDGFTVTIGLITAQSADYGTVKITQGTESGNKAGDTVTVQASANDKYTFVKWVSSDDINGDTVSKLIDGIHTFIINANTTLYAVFNGNGTDTPKNICDAAELEQISTNLNWNYALMADINLSSISSWTPIGTSSTDAFTGTFDGNGNTISGLNINVTTASSPSETDSANWQGLFGFSTGTVKNLSVEGEVTAGCLYVGGIVGRNHGTVENCASFVVVAGAGHVGGVVGANSGGNGSYPGTVSNCYSTGDVTASGHTYSYVGGVVGSNGGYQGTISYCYSTGSVSSGNPGNTIGGVVGTNATAGLVENCVALNPSVSVTPTGTNTPIIGRVVGNNQNNDANALTNNYAKSGMEINGTALPTGTGTATDKNGADVDIAATQNQAWWSTTGVNWGIVWGTTEAKPWQWNDEDKRPKLWFE